MLARIRDRLPAANTAKLKTAVRRYGSEKAKKFLANALAEAQPYHAP